MIVFFYLLWLIIGEAWSEALYDAGRKWQSKIVQSFWIASWFVLLLIEPSSFKYLLKVPIGYWILRICAFDIASAGFRHQDFNHQGTTTWIWDKIVNKVKPIWNGNLYFIACAIIFLFDVWYVSMS